MFTNQMASKGAGVLMFNEGEPQEYLEKGAKLC